MFIRVQDGVSPPSLDDGKDVLFVMEPRLPECGRHPGGPAPHPGSGSPSSLCVVGCPSWTLSSSFENHNNGSNDPNICLLMSTDSGRLPVSARLTPQASQVGPVTLQTRKRRRRQVQRLVQEAESGVGFRQAGGLPSRWQLCPLTPGLRGRFAGTGWDGVNRPVLTIGAAAPWWREPERTQDRGPSLSLSYSGFPSLLEPWAPRAGPWPPVLGVKL